MSEICSTAPRHKQNSHLFEEYLLNSLNATARGKHGKGVRRRLTPGSKLPGNWEASLRLDENKEELFEFLGELSITLPCFGK